MSDRWSTTDHSEFKAASRIFEGSIGSINPTNDALLVVLLSSEYRIVSLENDTFLY